jgi:tellurite resistance protein TerC
VTVPLWIWLLTLAGLGALIALDIRHARRPHEVGPREALTWSLVYVGAAVAFGVGLATFAGREPATAYFAGYLVEKSLSVDNLFVFAVVLSRFAVPARHQQRVLLIGVLGALVLRAVFIAVGAAMIERFAITFVLFGVFLLWTAVHLVRAHGQQPDVANSRGVRLLRRVLPVTEDYRHDTLFVRVAGRRAATPLLVVVVAILSVDLVFALDSIPAIFGITDSAYLVFTANAFALLGLRALYFLLVALLDRLVHLHYGLAVVLGFIGGKLVLHYAHTVNPSVPEVPTAVALLVVVGVLAVTTLTSLRASKPAPADRAEPTGAAEPARRSTHCDRSSRTCASREVTPARGGGAPGAS